MPLPYSILYVCGCAYCPSLRTASVNNCVAACSWDRPSGIGSHTKRDGPLGFWYDYRRQKTMHPRLETSTTLSGSNSLSSAHAFDDTNPRDGFPVSECVPTLTGPAILSSPRLIRSENQTVDGVRWRTLSSLPGATSICFPSEPLVFTTLISCHNRHSLVCLCDAYPE